MRRRRQEMVIGGPELAWEDHDASFVARVPANGASRIGNELEGADHLGYLGRRRITEGLPNAASAVEVMRSFACWTASGTIHTRVRRRSRGIDFCPHGTESGAA